MSYDRLSPESPIDTNIDRLAQVFPSVVREGKVDFDALRQLLGDDIGEPHELYGLNWKGKAQARRAALTPSLGTLRPCPEESVDWESTKNLYIEGDNLEVLKLLRKSYSGKVKMIYIDPPYNTGKEFVYPDDYQSGIGHYKKLTEQEKTLPCNVESNGKFHTDWLNMMYPRLMLARDLLCDDGIIFISIDENEFANIKLLLNLVFGEDNCVSDIVWKNRYNAAKEKHIAKIHEYIFVYTKCKSNLGNISIPTTEEYVSRYFKYKDEKIAIRGPFRLQPLEAGKSMDARPNLMFPIEAPDGTQILPKRQWKWDQNHVSLAIRSGEIYFNKVGDNWSVSTKQYLRDENGVDYGVKPFSIVENIYTQNATKEITEIFGNDKIFPFPKPVDLLVHLMNISDIKNMDIVMDFFSGSCTTAHALFKRFVEIQGTGRFVMVQLPEPCDKKSEAYKAGYKNICEIGKERIRRAGKKLKEEAGLIGQGLDTGFRVYKLDSSNVKPWDPDTEDLGASLDLFSQHLVEGRTSDDLLTEVMLKSGIDLCEEMETREIAGHRVYSLGYGQFYACMDRDLSGAEGELALGIAAWHAEECAAVGGEQQDTCTVFVADEAFAGRDDAKMNFVSTLQQYGICNVKAL